MKNNAHFSRKERSTIGVSTFKPKINGQRRLLAKIEGHGQQKSVQREKSFVNSFYKYCVKYLACSCIYSKSVKQLADRNLQKLESLRSNYPVFWQQQPRLRGGGARPNVSSITHLLPPPPRQSIEPLLMKMINKLTTFIDNNRDTVEWRYRAHLFILTHMYARYKENSKPDKFQSMEPVRSDTERRFRLHFIGTIIFQIESIQGLPPGEYRLSVEHGLEWRWCAIEVRDDTQMVHYGTGGMVFNPDPDHDFYISVKHISVSWYSRLCESYICPKLCIALDRVLCVCEKLCLPLDGILMKHKIPNPPPSVVFNVTWLPFRFVT